MTEIAQKTGLTYKAVKQYYGNMRKRKCNFLPTSSFTKPEDLSGPVICCIGTAGHFRPLLSASGCTRRCFLVCACLSSRR